MNIYKSHTAGTAHLTDFQIKIGDKTFNSIYQLHRQVLGLMVEFDGEYIPESFNKFLMEYLQLNGIIDIGEPEENNPDQIWFKVPKLKIEAPYQTSIFDFNYFEMRAGKLSLWSKESEIQDPEILVIEITPISNKEERVISSRIIPNEVSRPLSFLR